MSITQLNHQYEPRDIDSDQYYGSEYSVYTHGRGLTERRSQFINGLRTIIDFEDGDIVAIWFYVETVAEEEARYAARRHKKE